MSDFSLSFGSVAAVKRALLKAFPIVILISSP